VKDPEHSDLIELKAAIARAPVPQHVAIVMDGNGRWAERQGEHRMMGHSNGVRSVREALEGSVDIGVRYLTLYAFSTENWNRPRAEVEALMDLLVRTIVGEVEELHRNEVRLHAIGDLATLPGRCHQVLQEAIARTQNNDRITLTLALSYSARWEIVRMAQQVAQDVKNGVLEVDAIDENAVSARMATQHMPDPELLVRTSGEQRLSNFLLWQLAYAELHFTPVLWPDFTRKDLFRAVLDFQQRERRFGLTAKQLKA
jgi:undecaprenyl diphosphate synthase